MMRQLPESPMRIAPFLIASIVVSACTQESPTELSSAPAPYTDERVLAIHESSVFVDMHAHPSRFHR